MLGVGVATCAGRTPRFPPEAFLVSGPVPSPIVTRIGLLPLPPRDEGKWVGGYWHWGGTRFVWIPSHWESGHPGASWIAPRYGIQDGSFYYQLGRWK